MALLIDTAEAVVAALNAASADETLSQTFTAVRTYVAPVKLEDTDELTVTVMPASTRVELVSRGGAKQWELMIDVAIRKRSEENSPIDDADTFDPMVTLVEEIDELFLSKTIVAGAYTVHGLSVEEREAFNYDHADGLRQFTSVSRYTFMVVK